jgi:hypothetical protein
MEKINNIETNLVGMGRKLDYITSVLENQEERLKSLEEKTSQTETLGFKKERATWWGRLMREKLKNVGEKPCAFCKKENAMGRYMYGPHIFFACSECWELHIMARVYNLVLNDKQEPVEL